MGWAEAVTGPACGVRLLAPASLTLPQAWHSPQRPTHLGARHPHSEHRKAALAALLDVMPATLPGPSDNGGAQARDDGPRRRTIVT